MALLGHEFDLEASDGHAAPVLGAMERVTNPDFLDSSMRIDEHAAVAAQWALTYSPRSPDTGTLDLERLPPLEKPAARRRFIYTSLVTRSYPARDTPRDPVSLAAKLGRFLRPGKVSAAVRCVRAHAKLVAGNVRPAAWNCQLRLTFNALPFDVRRSKARMQVPQRASPLSSLPFPCYLCGRGHDSAKHVYTRCSVVKAAWVAVVALTRFGRHHALSTTLLAYTPTTSPLPTLLVVLFNHSVWKVRTHFARTLTTLPPPAHFIERMVDGTLSTLPLCTSGPRDDPYIISLATSPPKSAIIGFTDGSAIPNPGPSGAGFTLAIPGRRTEHKSIAIGHGTNNDGEMVAIHRLLSCLLHHRSSGHVRGRPPVLIFSDSAICLGYLLHGWSPPQGVASAEATRALLHQVQAIFPLRLYWIRGHREIPGNERADKLAKAGAQRSALRLLAGATLPIRYV